MIQFLSDLKLSVTQWLGVMAAIVIGGLVAALKLQGSRLHRAQLKILEQDRDRAQEKADGSAFEAGKRYHEALNEFLNAGGKLLLLAALALSSPAIYGSDSSDLLPKCVKALNACNDYLAAKDAQIKALQDSVEAYKKAAGVGQPERRAGTVLTASVAGGAGGCAGSAAGHADVLVGCAVGGVIGFLIGLAVDGGF